MSNRVVFKRRTGFSAPQASQVSTDDSFHRSPVQGRPDVVEQVVHRAGLEGARTLPGGVVVGEPRRPRWRRISQAQALGSADRRTPGRAVA
jgi:hypothetical protein